MRIDLIRNVCSRFDVLSVFTEELGSALRAAGIQSTTLDLRFLTLEEFQNYCREIAPDAFIGFNVFDFKNEYIDKEKYPLLSIVVDAPFHYPEIFEAEEQIFAFVDKRYQKLVGEQGHSKAFFLPHAVSKESLKGSPKKNRPYDIVMAGSLFEEPVSKDKDEAFWEVAARSQDKRSMLSILSSYPVHIFATEEEKKICHSWLPHNAFIFHEPVPYRYLSEVFSKAKIVLNSMPTLQEGLHERLLLALSKGASVVSSPSSYAEQFFKEDSAVSYYRSYDELEEKVQKILSNEKKRREDVEEARKVVLHNHTWERRLERILDILWPCL